MFAGVGLGLASLAPICGSSDPVATPTAGPTEAATAVAPSPSAEPSVTAHPKIVLTSTPAAVAATAPASTSTPITNKLPTATSVEQGMGITGRMWLDGRLATGDVAFIGGQQCGRGKTETPPPTPLLVLQIASNAEQAGCGVPGAIVNFTLNGRPANETISWQPGIGQPFIALSAGAQLAIFQGTIKIGAGTAQGMLITPYVDGVACGSPSAPGPLSGTDANWSYEVVVDSVDVTPGCGQAGSDVVLRLRADGQADITLATLPWMALPPTQILTIDLTDQILVGSTLPTGESAQ